MKKIILSRAIFTMLLILVSITVHSMKHNYGCRGDIIIYVGEQTTVSHPFPNYPYVDDDGWYLRATTGASWSEGKEKGGAKIISDNGFSCTIKGMWDNTGDSNFSLALYCYGTIQSKNEEYECYWNVIVKSRDALTLSATPAGGTVTQGTNVYLSTNASGAKIFYTTDGSIPSYDLTTYKPLASTVNYSSAGITIDKSCVVKAIAHKEGYNDSEIMTWEYKIPDEDGDIFEATTTEGIKMKFRVIDSEQKTCQVFGGFYTKDGKNHRAYAVAPATTSGPVTIPSNAGGFTVVAIRPGAFSDCYRITSISVPSTVTEIRYDAFKGCKALTEITGGENVVDVEMSSFEDCAWFTNQSDGLLYFGKTLLGWKGTIPDNTKISNLRNGILKIASSAFYSQKGLTAIDIPGSVIEIGSSAFYDTGLTSITIPNSVTTIGMYAFSCPNLSSLTIPDNVETIGSYALYKCESLKSLYIGKNLRTLGGMNIYMKNLKSIVVSSDNMVFDSRDNCNAVIETASNTLLLGCSATEIPESVVEIGNHAFYGNGSNEITNITIPDQVAVIGNYAFTELEKLQSIVLGRGVKEIGIRAFGQCSSLKEIRAKMSEPPLLKRNPFQSVVYDEAILYVPFNTKSKYETAEGWSEFKNIQEVSDETSYAKGDVNIDNAVNGTDLVALSNIVLGRKEKTEPADVNGDGSVNGTDIVALSNIILGRSNKALQRAAATGASLSIDPFDIKAGETKEMLIDLTNPNDEITLVQFDLHLPEGLAVKKSGSDLEFDMADRTSWRKHTLDANEVDDGYRFLLYSSSNTLIEGTEGAIIKVTLVADDSFVSGDIKLDNILLVNPNETEYKPNDVQISVGKLPDFVYYIGATDGWTNAEQKLALTDDNSIYTGYVYCADPNGWGNEFKFQKTSGNWDTEINTGHMTGGITGDFGDGGGNFKATAGEGVYFVTLDMANMSINAVRINNMNLVGDFNGWNAADDAQQMTWDAENCCYVITSAGVTANGWKFTANNNWDINLGGDALDNLVANGANLTVVGTIVKLYPTRKDKDNICCTVENVEPATGTILSVEPFDIKAGETKEMLIDLTNPNDEVTLVQFDLHLPAGLSIKKNGADLVFDMAERTSWRKHTLDANEVDNGYRFLLYSSSNTLIEGTEGAIIKVTLVANDSFEGGKIGIDNALLVSPDEKETKPASYEYEIGSGTGISTVKMDAGGQRATIYNLRGQRLTALQKGINIIGGKKVVVK